MKLEKWKRQVNILEMIQSYEKDLDFHQGKLEKLIIKVG